MMLQPFCLLNGKIGDSSGASTFGMIPCLRTLLYFQPCMDDWVPANPNSCYAFLIVTEQKNRLF